MERQKVSIKDINNTILENTPAAKRANLPRDFFSYKPKMYKNLALPSYVHGYSLAIEYMKKWFVDKFPENYFKTIHINGKHVLDDWKHFNNYNIAREKPMLAIVPTLDYEYDREFLDAYMADPKLLLARSDFQQSFIKDYNSMTFLYMQMRALKMNFTFKIRVGTRSQQLDLFNRMELWFRIGATQHEYINADFHVPYDIMLNIAEANHFEIKDNKIVDILEFINYLNSHSDLPIIFKMRAINQKPEFFVRINNLYTHISCRDKISMDDGERSGKLDTNFHLELQCTLTIPIPHFYAYFAQIPTGYNIATNERTDTSIGIYSINNFEIPPENKYGWGRVAQTGYLCEKGEKFIDISPILLSGEGHLTKVIKYSIENGINPNSFLDIKIYRSDDKEKLVPFIMEYNNCTIYFNNPIEREEAVDIVIYADKGYINNTIISLENIMDSRIESPKS